MFFYVLVYLLVGGWSLSLFLCLFLSISLWAHICQVSWKNTFEISLDTNGIAYFLEVKHQTTKIINLIRIDKLYYNKINDNI